MIEEMDEGDIMTNTHGCIENPMRNYYAEQQGLEYMSTKTCLVGEAHHYHANYYNNCLKCENMCGANYAGIAMCNGGKTFQAFKLDLFTHMLEAHPQLMIK